MQKDHEKIKEQISPFLAPSVRAIIGGLAHDLLIQTEEIRLRCYKALMVIFSGYGEAFLDEMGRISSYSNAYIVTNKDLEKTLELISGYSLYAYEEEIRQGYLTIPGGHRIGLAGRAVIENCKVKILTHINSMNFRIARQVLGAGEKVLPFIIDRCQNRVYHTMIISPPQAGKTTLLRDLARAISNGEGVLGRGLKVSVIDERSEIAGCYKGIPQLNIGYRTDVIDACPKAIGIMMALRSLSPRVIVTDEIGCEKDIKAVEEAVYAGVTVIASAHGSNLEDIFRRPILSHLISKNYFERLVFLSSSNGPGTIESIIEGEKGLPLYSSRGGGK